jgi:fluoride ion exporter CrcB/FEX
VIAVGGLGAFTTFSRFAREAVALRELRALANAGVYVVGTLVLGSLAAAVGIELAAAI